MPLTNAALARWVSRMPAGAAGPGGDGQRAAEGVCTVAMTVCGTC